MDAGFALLGLATGTLVGMTGVGAGSPVPAALTRRRLAVFAAGARLAAVGI